jgi:hypothetical protein
VTLISSALREAVVSRAAGQCEYCRLSQVSQVATFPVDHVVPRSRGGLTILENLALACPSCNALKWAAVEAMDPATGTLAPIFNPRTQRWHEHFRWSSEDSSQIVALSPVGRATVALLELDAPTRVEIRRLLRILSLHPPA